MHVFGFAANINQTGLFLCLAFMCFCRLTLHEMFGLTSYKQTISLFQARPKDRDEGEAWS